jgi:hypothetical protein
MMSEVQSLPTIEAILRAFAGSALAALPGTELVEALIIVRTSDGDDKVFSVLQGKWATPYSPDVADHSFAKLREFHDILGKELVRLGEAAFARRDAAEAEGFRP